MRRRCRRVVRRGSRSGPGATPRSRRTSRPGHARYEQPPAYRHGRVRQPHHPEPDARHQQVTTDQERTTRRRWWCASCVRACCHDSEYWGARPAHGCERSFPALPRATRTPSRPAHQRRPPSLPPRRGRHRHPDPPATPAPRATWPSTSRPSPNNSVPSDTSRTPSGDPNTSSLADPAARTPSPRRPANARSLPFQNCHASCRCSASPSGGRSLTSSLSEGEAGE